MLGIHVFPLFISRLMKAALNVTSYPTPQLKRFIFRLYNDSVLCVCFRSNMALREITTAHVCSSLGRGREHLVRIRVVLRACVITLFCKTCGAVG